MKLLNFNFDDCVNKACTSLAREMGSKNQPDIETNPVPEAMKTRKLQHIFLAIVGIFFK